MLFGLLFLGICGLAVQGFMPAGKENFLSDALLREVVERMSRDLASASDSYLDNTDVRCVSLFIICIRWYTRAQRRWKRKRSW